MPTRPSELRSHGVQPERRAQLAAICELLAYLDSPRVELGKFLADVVEKLSAVIGSARYVAVLDVNVRRAERRSQDAVASATWHLRTTGVPSVRKNKRSSALPGKPAQRKPTTGRFREWAGPAVPR